MLMVKGAGNHILASCNATNRNSCVTLAGVDACSQQYGSDFRDGAIRMIVETSRLCSIVNLFGGCPFFNLTSWQTGKVERQTTSCLVPRSKYCAHNSHGRTGGRAIKRPCGEVSRVTRSDGLGDALGLGAHLVEDDALHHALLITAQIVTEAHTA